MKNFYNALLLFSVFSLLFSCSSDNEDSTTPDDTNLMTLNHRITYYTSTLYPTESTKRIQYFVDNKIVADTLFNNLDQWIKRYTVTTTPTANGTTKTFETLDNTNQVIERQEEKYDSQGRMVSRQQLPPSMNVLEVKYFYNSNGSVTVEGFNHLTSRTDYIATFYKNSEGLITRVQRPMTFSPGQTFEQSLLFDGLKPTTLVNNENSNTVSFNYYPNLKPSNLIKTTTELNNRILNGISLQKLAEEGNFYYKRNNNTSDNSSSTNETSFNANNYITHHRLTYLNIQSNTSIITETFYYYN